jgi:hypothetical protein
MDLPARLRLATAEAGGVASGGNGDAAHTPGGVGWPKHSSMRTSRFVLVGLFCASAAHAAPQGPALDPPAVIGATEVEEAGPRRMAASAGQVEWLWHASLDRQHPSAEEQCSLWLMNEARRDPAAEGVFLATLDDPNVQSALGWFRVDLDVLQAEFAALDAKPPAAFDARLWDAAWQHSLYLIANDAQNHTDQFTRVSQAGFHGSSMRGNVFSYSESALYGHAGFNVDWGGSDGTGMQTGRGHRKAIMSIDGDYTNAGIAVVPEWNAATQVGPQVVTGNYARASTSWPDHHNRFVVGTVWHDANENDRYDEGEGFAGVTVTPSAGPYFAVTSAGGGYAIPVLEEGAFALTFSGGGIATGARQVQVGATSVLVNHDPLDPSSVPEPAATAGALVALLALTVAGATRSAHGFPSRRSGCAAAQARSRCLRASPAAG